MNRTTVNKGVLLLLIFLCPGLNCTNFNRSVFNKKNLIAWCIVPFDSKNRNPQERAEMLQRLGFRTFAYDWRDVNIPEFDEEIIQLKKSGIEMKAFWWVGGLPGNKEELKASQVMMMQTDFFKRNLLNLQVWVTLSDDGLQNLPDSEKYTELARRADILAAELKNCGCSVGLYNHGGWGGMPQNLIETVKRTKSGNVGIVYNFHHAHEHLAMMPDAFLKLVPYLYCVNLNGMNSNGPKILPLGEGSEDLKIIKMISGSGYRGPIGIIGHKEDEDAELVLKQNLEGLRKLLLEIGDREASNSY